MPMLFYVAKKQKVMVPDFEIKNEMITAVKTRDKIMFRVLREAVNQNDVELCLGVFNDLLETKLQPDEKVRVLVDARIDITTPKWDIVKAFSTHFIKNLKKYMAHLTKCALVVNGVALSNTFTGVVGLILNDKKRILVTHRIDRAQEFLKE